MQDLAFIFFMSLGKDSLDQKFCETLIKSPLTQVKLTGHALMITHFKDEEDPLNDQELKAFCLAHLYQNRQRPIVKWYGKVIVRASIEGTKSFLTRKISQKGYDSKRLQTGVAELKKHCAL